MAPAPTLEHHVQRQSAHPNYRDADLLPTLTREWMPLEVLEHHLRSDAAFLDRIVDDPPWWGEINELAGAQNPLIEIWGWNDDEPIAVRLTERGARQQHAAATMPAAH